VGLIDAIKEKRGVGGGGKKRQRRLLQRGASSRMREGGATRYQTYSEGWIEKAP